MPDTAPQIDLDDLKAGVAAGILSEPQAAALRTLAVNRHGAKSGLSAIDEPFELFRGFNEIFIVTGLLILTFGWVSGVSLYLMIDPFRIQQAALMPTVIGAGVLWWLSEYFILRRRMVAPAIVLTVLFAANIAAGSTVFYSGDLIFGFGPTIPMPMALTAAAIFLHWLRFRVPFAMALIAISLFALAMVAAANLSGTPRDFQDVFLLTAGGPYAWITVVLGLVAFIGAMWFDTRDPHRISRLSSNGFWLHVVAAPALVNPVALTLMQADSFLALVGLAVALAGFAALAIVIDRRSFLIAAIGYVVSLMSLFFEGLGAAGAVLVLGLVLLFLGAQWHAARRVLMGILPACIPRNRLPPCG